MKNVPFCGEPTMCKSRSNANAGLQPKQVREIIWKMLKHPVSTFFQNKTFFLASLFQNSFSYLNNTVSQKEKKG